MWRAYFVETGRSIRCGAGALLDEQTRGKMHSAGARTDRSPGAQSAGSWDTSSYAHGGRGARVGDASGTGSRASRFFYCAKTSKAEREAGLENFAARIVNDGRETSIDNPYQRGDTLRKNTHPTVKPQSLMRWLCRLVTPPGGLVLDPFCGSGSTGCAALKEGFRFIGIDSDLESVRIARARLAHWSKP